MAGKRRSVPAGRGVAGRDRAQGRIRVNAGRPPALTGYPDFFWFNCDETEATAALVADIVARRILARFGLDPRRDVQVLCPMHRGPAGAGNLNLLQPPACLARSQFIIGRGAQTKQTLPAPDARSLCPRGRR